LSPLHEAISYATPPALLIGNGINRFSAQTSSSWEDLLNELASGQGLSLSPAEMAEMSNTEFFDVLDLARPQDDKLNLQKEFCRLMATWEPAAHHERIVRWAERKNTPIITVNFDENLSRAVDADFVRSKNRFTDFYPWGCYFSSQDVSRPREAFAIWHAHGMMRYSRSIRLGLTHYMGAVQRARSWVYARQDGLRRATRLGVGEWRGADTWLDILFHSPLMIFGFGFRKDENFFRWLFLERARLHKIAPHLKQKTWFVEVQSDAIQHRKPFFERLGVDLVTVETYQDIYAAALWDL